MNPKFNSLERAQIMLELLTQISPNTYSTALKMLCQISRIPVILERVGVGTLIESLPHEPEKSLKELRIHLGAMQAGCSDAETHSQIWSLLKRLPERRKALLQCT
jgi:hypothetical protein